MLGEQFTEEGQCWGRISAGDVCSRQYHEQIDAQLTRLVLSLTGEAAQLQE